MNSAPPRTAHITINANVNMDAEAAEIVGRYAETHGLSTSEAIGRLLDLDPRFPINMGVAFASAVLAEKYRKAEG